MDYRFDCSGSPLEIWRRGEVIENEVKLCRFSHGGLFLIWGREGEERGKLDSKRGVNLGLEQCFKYAAAAPSLACFLYEDLAVVRAFASYFAY